MSKVISQEKLLEKLEGYKKDYYAHGENSHGHGRAYYDGVVRGLMMAINEVKACDGVTDKVTEECEKPEDNELIKLKSQIGAIGLILVMENLSVVKNIKENKTKSDEYRAGFTAGILHLVSVSNSIKRLIEEENGFGSTGKF